MKLLGCKVCGRIAHGHAGLKVCCSNDDCPLSRVLMLPDQWNQRCKGEVEAREQIKAIKKQADVSLNPMFLKLTTGETFRFKDLFSAIDQAFKALDTAP